MAKLETVFGRQVEEDGAFSDNRLILRPLSLRLFSL
jgi:hypothetical protein